MGFLFVSWSPLTGFLNQAKRFVSTSIRTISYQNWQRGAGLVDAGCSILFCLCWSLVLHHTLNEDTQMIDMNTDTEILVNLSSKGREGGGRRRGEIGRAHV